MQYLKWHVYVKFKFSWASFVFLSGLTPTGSGKRKKRVLEDPHAGSSLPQPGRGAYYFAYNSLAGTSHVTWPRGKGSRKDCSALCWKIERSEFKAMQGQAWKVSQAGRRGRPSGSIHGISIH